MSVKDLQAALFPPTSKSSTSFFANFVIKNQIFEDEELEDRINKEAPLRELYAFARESNFTPQLPRWPTECQVLEERVKHINYAPAAPEAYYTPTGREVQPKPTGDECGIVVYQYTPISAVNYVSIVSNKGFWWRSSETVAPLFH